MASGAEQLITSREFERILRGARQAVFRLETLPEYREPSEQAWLRAFTRGDWWPPACPEQDEWEAMLRAKVAAGVLFQRVHVVTEPLSPYLQFELCWAYPPNAAAGERIRIADASRGWPDRVPRFDFWVIDGSRYDVAYSRDGQLFGVTARGWRRETHPWVLASIRQSTPLEVFLAARPQLSARALSVRR